MNFVFIPMYNMYIYLCSNSQQMVVFTNAYRVHRPADLMMIMRYDKMFVNFIFMRVGSM